MIFIDIFKWFYYVINFFLTAPYVTIPFISQRLSRIEMTSNDLVDIEIRSMKGSKVEC